MKPKVLITGDRNWQSWKVIEKALEGLPQDSLIIHGDARGADRIAGKVAARLDMEVEAHPAKWNAHIVNAPEGFSNCPQNCTARFHKQAGPIRNREMLDQAPDVVYAFHDNLQTSKGTKDCIREAERRGIKTILWVSRLTDGVKTRTESALQTISKAPEETGCDIIESLSEKSLSPSDKNDSPQDIIYMKDL